MSTVEVQFKVKSETKVVAVDFFSQDYRFMNHLKRCALDQIRGSVQKNTILNLINNGNFTVIKDNDTVYVFEDKSSVTATNSDSDSSLLVSTISTSIETTLSNETQIERYYSSNNIEEVCEQLDILEEQSCKLHLRLQHLLGLEEQILHEKLALI